MSIKQLLLKVLTSSPQATSNEYGARKNLRSELWNVRSMTWNGGSKTWNVRSKTWNGNINLIVAISILIYEKNNRSCRFPTINIRLRAL